MTTPSIIRNGDSAEFHLVFDLGRSMRVLSNAVLGGGIADARYIVNRTVPEDWCAENPRIEMQEYLAAHGLPFGDTVGLLTAVPVEKFVCVTALRGLWKVDVFVTAGVRNAAMAGGLFPNYEAAGTINTIVLVHGNLSTEALIGAVITATEAKVGALRNLNVETPFGECATGTTTDTVTIANLAQTPVSEFAGLATDVGFVIGQAVCQAVTEAVLKALAVKGLS